MTWKNLATFPDTSWMMNAVFGCDALGFIPPEKQRKYDNPAFRGTFGGWDMTRKFTILFDHQAHV
jgi:hypothetical protein